MTFHRLMVFFTLLGLPAAHAQNMQYLQATTDTLTFLTWTQAQSQLQGSYQQIRLSTATGGKPTLITRNGTLSGLVAGNDLSLTFQEEILGKGIFQAQGTVTGKTLTLLFPSSGGGFTRSLFSATTLNEYANWVDGMKSTLKTRVAQWEKQQAQEQLEQQEKNRKRALFYAAQEAQSRLKGLLEDATLYVEQVSFALNRLDTGTLRLTGLTLDLDNRLQGDEAFLENMVDCTDWQDARDILQAEQEELPAEFQKALPPAKDTVEVWSVGDRLLQDLSDAWKTYQQAVEASEGQAELDIPESALFTAQKDIEGASAKLKAAAAGDGQEVQARLQKYQQRYRQLMQEHQLDQTCPFPAEE
ncbi:hypothetical protein [Deinococcus cellulosilyticus]|uniref:Uncharacterized protein n=1 Tax=Deinococcus cellulosilyticus (strain DSM 18568 / NBRC 106333 / KACC 11606 / 5516J-15) TaxID=1223518 RepID=A0A511NB46_DEIC1|nr:hypothetical protein [Deinococcus cellulosilyticus]GEM49786.1 hypothetical protein DC3_54210 [Deinococcus cellulosilyticus NBRC 106333 = KACC 11606]